MTVFNEGQHTGEFLVSEGNGAISREVGTLAAGQNLKDGTVLSFDNDELVALAAATEAPSADDIAGILYGNYDTTGGAQQVPYIARLAEVKADLLTKPEEVSASDLSAALAGKLIITRAS